MHPTPLTDPTGTIRAYACGRCGHVSNPFSPWGVPDDVAAANEQQAETTRQEADECCRCRECGADLPADERSGLCDACDAARETKNSADAEAYQARDRKRTEANDATIAAAGGDAAAALLLCELMRDMSEECWCAGWLDGCEFSLWRFAIEGPGPWGQSLVGDLDVDRLRALSARARGWWRWDSDAGGEVFVPLPEWERLYAEHVSAAP